MMKKAKLWKVYNPDRLFGGYSWAIEETVDDWDGVSSDPYIIGIPDEFNICESVTGEKLFYRGDDQQGYRLYSTSNKEGCSPILVGGTNPEIVKLKVIGPADSAEL